jgi:large subunit ribosomal protein L30e
MDLNRQLKTAIATGSLRFGQRQALDACARGEAKLIIFAANCPTEFADELHANHPEVTKFRSTLVNRELGIACSKPFSISTISIIDAGESDLLQLESNIE